MLNKFEYIVVDSISSVDPNTLSLGQLNQKFIDKQGNRFALRFNRDTRRLEFVRIALESPNEAQKHKQVSRAPVRQVLPSLDPSTAKKFLLCKKSCLKPKSSLLQKFQNRVLFKLLTKERFQNRFFKGIIVKPETFLMLIWI